MREARRTELAERCTERLRRAEALAFEPPPTQASTITLAVRLRDGGRIQRRFEHSTRLVDVFAWVGAHVPAALARFTLVSRYPRVTLDVEEERQGARTLEEVGREFGVTRERIRQIESKTLAKLRHPHRSQKLRDYLDTE